MEVNHNVTDVDRKLEHQADAHEKRQQAEDAETIRVRGPQRPADQPDGLQQPVQA